MVIKKIVEQMKYDQTISFWSEVESIKHYKYSKIGYTN